MERDSYRSIFNIGIGTTWQNAIFFYNIPNADFISHTYGNNRKCVFNGRFSNIHDKTAQYCREYTVLLSLQYIVENS